MTAEDDKKPRWSLRRFERVMLPERFFYPGNEEPKRIAVIAYLTVLIAVIALLVIGVWRICYHERILGWLNFLFAMVLAGIIICHRRTKKTHNYLALYTGIAAYAVFIYCLFLFSKYDRATYLWSYIFPLMVFPLAGSRRGAAAMILFLIPISLLLAFDPLSFMDSYPQDFKIFYAPSVLAISVLSYIYERNRERTQRQLNLINAALRKSNEEMEQRIQERTAELARSEEKYRFLTDEMIDIIFTADMNLNLTYVSPSVSKVLGYSQEEYRRLPFYERVTPDSLHKVMALYALEIEKEKTPGVRPERSLTVELESRHKNGSTVWSEVVMRGIRDNEGNLVGLHGVSREITDRKQKEKTLKKQSDKLRDLSAKLSETEETERRRISRELHDQVGQNLATLGLNLNILKSRLPAGYTGAIRKHTEESLMLLEQTTEFIRELMGDLRPPVMDDYGLIAAIRWYGKRFAMQTGIEFTFRGQDDFPRPKALIEMTFYRIFQEAMINAWKHSQAKKVDVSVEIDKNTLRLTVFDNGVGFDLDRLSEIDQDRGWGLTTMAERAELIGGIFSVESHPGQGTRITVEAVLWA